jgi:hypothetical protein
MATPLAPASAGPQILLDGAGVEDCAFRTL